MSDYAKYLQPKKREDGTEFTTMTDDAPEWFRDMVHKAHFDLMPNDWSYRIISDAVDAIAEGVERDDFTDTGIPVYTSDHLQWLASSLSRMAFCDDALEQFGAPKDTDTLIWWGMSIEYGMVYDVVKAAIDEQEGDE